MKMMLSLCCAVCAALSLTAAEKAHDQLLKELDAKNDKNRINLHRYGEMKAEYQKLIDTAKTPFEKANARISYAQYEWRCAMDDEPAKWEKYQRDAFAETKGLSGRERLALLKRNIPGLDWRKEADAIFAVDPTCGYWYYNGLIDNPPSAFSGYDWRLQVAEKALADAKMTINRWVFEDMKVDALIELGRSDEAVRFCRDARAHARLGKVYRRLAARYYDTPDRATVEKAIAACREALAERPDAAVRKEIVELAFSIDDYATAREQLDALVAAAKDGKPDAWTAPRLGDLAFYAKDYETAVRYYSLFEKMDVPRAPWNSNNRHMESLYALGRYEECLKAMDKVMNKMTQRDVNDKTKQVLKEVIAAGGRPAETDRLAPRRQYDPRNFRLLCYNIRMGAGAEDWDTPFKRGELRGLPRVARTIAESGAHVVALQEVDENAERSGEVDMAKYLAAATGLKSTFSDKIPMGKGRYGLAQLAPEKPLSVRKVVLPHSDHPADHPRLCQICEYPACFVATAHFPLKPEACVAAAKVVVKELANPSKTVIFCGDLNLLPDSEGIAVLKQGFTMLSDPSQFTCHALHPDICLDYFFVDTAHAGQVKASGYTVGTSQASDHLPIWIDLEIR